ncbi:dephospho-CoA kinase [Oscillatoria sp. FACHB-1407]|uniref:dephospho-CoA kinase n=1 Tax=Oscillatoria sp. FACHB-1407 TaxID=2692847 RepID=UPI0016827361|nr:dephospho-CoA kinase [Oscillatoria sp. FACHB-1407]MBD2462497.1 dephospho-CoA kinase [Oscillatoria sp. FACHB-1407]
MSDNGQTFGKLPQRIIGITGGVGMGKTTISNHLATIHHLPVLDADLYAREAVQPGSAVYREIVERYGSSILLPNKTLDRARLGEIVFNNSSERLWLEQRIHPYVRDRIEVTLRELGTQGVAIAVLVIPLLFEARMTDLVNEIWVVSCSTETQVERLMQRDHLNLEQIHARINSQMPIDQKLKRANVVLDNSSTPEALLHQVNLALTRPQSETQSQMSTRSSVEE